MKKIWYVYTVEYYSAIKKKGNNTICSNMDGPRDYHTEKTRLYDTTYIWNLKNNTNEHIYKTETDSQM